MKSFFEKDKYEIDDLKSLIENQIEESIHLDFKAGQALSKQESKKKELSKDIAAFANSDGGIIIYGINEENHVAKSLSYIDGNEFPKEWLEQVINTTINRRINNILIYPIRENGKINRTMYVVKIPKSIDAPHQSKDKRFYKRFNFESVMMEEYEIRQLYGRKIKSELLINQWATAQLTSEDDNRYNYSCSIQIYNSGDISEKNYKVNVIFENYDSRMNIQWPSNKQNVSFTILEKDRVKISSESNSSIFPNETINVLRFNIDVQKAELKDVFERVKIKIFLFYDNGEDLMETDLIKTIENTKKK